MIKNNFKIGDKVIVNRVNFTKQEWEPIGQVEVPFNINDILTILEVYEAGPAKGSLLFVEDPYKNWYPNVGFSLYNKNKIIETNMKDLMLDVLNKTYDNLKLRRTTIPLFMSNPGTGKTTTIKKFAEEKGVNLLKITLSQRMPNEVVGMVMPDSPTKKLLVFDSHELSLLKDGDILFFDEVFNGTLKQTLDAVLNLLEDRILPSGKKLADVMIVAASNPQGLINLTPQIKERFIRFDLMFSRVEFQDYLKDKYGMPTNISAHLCTLIEKEKFESNDWNFSTPRSIERAINQIACELPSPYTDILTPFLNIKIQCPVEIEDLKIEKNDSVEYLNLLKLIIKNDNKNLKQKSDLAANISN